MKRTNKKQKKKVATATAVNTKANLMGIKFQTKTPAEALTLARAVMVATESHIFYDCYCDLTQGYKMKEILQSDRPFLFNFFGFSGKPEHIIRGSLFMHTMRSFQEIKKEIDGYGKATWSILPCHEAKMRMFAILLQKDPNHACHTWDEDYAHRISQHLLDHTGKKFEIACGNSGSVQSSNSVPIRIFTIDAKVSLVKEIQAALLEHPMKSLELSLEMDVLPRAHLQMLQEQRKMLKSYIGIRVSGLAKSNAEELRALLQQMEGKPKDIDMASYGRGMGEFVILADRNCKAAVLQKVSQYLNNSNTGVNCSAYPELFPEGPFVDEEHFPLLDPAVNDTLSTFHEHVTNVRRMKAAGQPEVEVKEEATKAVVSILVALKRYPHHSWLQRLACLALCDVGLQPGVDCTGIIVRYGGIQSSVMVMQERCHDKVLLYLLLKLLGIVLYEQEGALEIFDGKAQRCILSSMQMHKNCPGIQDMGLLALGGLHYSAGQKDDQNLTTVTEQIEICISAMTTFPDSLCMQDHGCILLNNVMLNSPQTIDTVVKSGGFQVILSIANAEASGLTLRAHCCLTLPHFLTVEALWQECFDTVMAIMKLYTTDEGIQEAACYFLSKAVGCVKNMSLFVESGAVSYLSMALVQHPTNIELRESGSCALSLVIQALGWAALVDGFDILRQLLKVVVGGSGDFELDWMVCQAMNSLISGSSPTDLDEHSFEVGYILGFAEDMMEVHDETGFQQACLEMIWNIASFSLEWVILMAANNLSVIDVIISGMKSNPSQEEFIELSCRVLWSITTTQDTKVLERCVEVDAMEDILQGVIKFPQNKTILNLGGTTAFRIRDYEGGWS